MRTDVKISQKVTGWCPNTNRIDQPYGAKVTTNDIIVCRLHEDDTNLWVARVLGIITEGYRLAETPDGRWIPDQSQSLRGHLVCLVLSIGMNYASEYWVDPKNVIEVQHADRFDYQSFMMEFFTPNLADKDNLDELRKHGLTASSKNILRSQSSFPVSNSPIYADKVKSND